MKLINNLLFEKSKSSLSLFLLVPILICVSLGCLCSGGRESYLNDNCLTADDQNLVLGYDNSLRIVSLGDGKEIANEPKKIFNVLCTSDNNVLTIENKEVSSDVKEKNVTWRNDSKNYGLANIKAIQKYHGFIQKKYFVSSSRIFHSERVNKGSQKNPNYIEEYTYFEPQIFNLEDSTTGQVTSHTLTYEKLGLPTKSNLYEKLTFFPLHLSEEGILLFVLRNYIDGNITTYQINMLSGTVKQIRIETKPTNEFLKFAVSDKLGKFIVYVYNNQDKTTRFDVINLETNKIVTAKTIQGINPTFIFDKKSLKLAMLMSDSKSDPRERIYDVTIYDLQNGNEISKINLNELFKESDDFKLLGLIGDELIITYESGSYLGRNMKKHLAKVNLVTKQIIWDIA